MITQPQGLLAGKPLEFFDDYWLEYYRPLALSSFQKIFSYRMNSTLRYVPFKSTQGGRYDLSPFRVRSGNEHDSPEKARSSKSMTVASPQDGLAEIDASQGPIQSTQPKGKALPTWLQTQLKEQPLRHIIFRDSLPGVNDTTHANFEPSMNKPPKDKSAITQWTLDQFVVNSLNPSVQDSEAYEYERYINHPLNLPLVVSTDTPPNPNLEFIGYINSISEEAVLQMTSTEDDIADYMEFLEVGEDPLTVTEADTPKKRYKAYRQWLKGKSLFKQQRVDT